MADLIPQIMSPRYRFTLIVEKESTLIELIDKLPECHHIRQEYEELLKSLNALKELDKWCDERRSKPDWTTLGMIQEKIRELIQK